MTGLKVRDLVGSPEILKLHHCPTLERVGDSNEN